MDGLHNNLLGLGEHEYLGWRFNLTFAVSTQGQSLKKKFKKPYQVIYHIERAIDRTSGRFALSEY